jgi:hypothetical protein
MICYSLLLLDLPLCQLVLPYLKGSSQISTSGGQSFLNQWIAGNLKKEIQRTAFMCLNLVTAL